MSTTPWDAFRNIGVAVSFDEHAAPLVALAGRLAARTGKRLLLLHAVEPWHEGLLARNVADAIVQRASSLAKGRLVELSSFAPEGVEVETAVVVGKPAEALAAAALAKECCLLCVGATRSGTASLLSGMSTAMALMAACPVATLVVDAANGMRVPEGGSLRILVADDLSDGSEAAVELGAALAASLGEARLHHVHVSPLGEGELRDALASAAAASRAPLDSATSAHEVLAALRATQVARLEERGSLQREYVEEAGGSYTSEVLSGAVRAELGTVVKGFGPDLLVFGRHAPVHRKPLHFGRMPLRAMLAHGKPVVVVPGA